MQPYLSMLDRIKRDEGFRARPYVCPTGFWTIGYGTRYLFTGKGFKPVVQTTDEVTRYLAELHLITAVHKAVGEAQSFVTNFKALSPVRQCCLVMMAYQLGGNGLHGFKKTKHYIEHNEWLKAAKEMLDSKWAKQTFSRAERTADMFYLDKWL